MFEATRSKYSPTDVAGLSRSDIAAILGRVHREASLPGPLLLYFTSGPFADPCCDPMPRDPLPPTGAALDLDFVDHLIAALSLNPAIHDGAIMFHREDTAAPFRVAGWSHRMRAPIAEGSGQSPNRGSAFNSCLATSARPGVNAACILSRGTITLFVNGFEQDAIAI